MKKLTKKGNNIDTEENFKIWYNRLKLDHSFPYITSKLDNYYEPYIITHCLKYKHIWKKDYIIWKLS